MNRQNHDTIDYKNKRLFSYFFIIFLVFGSLLAGTIGALYTLESQDYVKRIRLEEKVNIDLQLAIVSDNFNSITSDLLFLSRQNELLRLINHNETRYTSWISDEYLEMARRKKKYDQIRYLDQTGMEIVRVNYNNGTPQIVEKNRLQFKGNRYYFKDTFEAGVNQIFVSPLDLNIEKGKIETPYKPMIRFGTPVFDSRQKKRGIVLLNYLGRGMLSSITEASTLSPGRTMLLNRDGFWLLSPDKENEWGFMIESRKDKKFSKAYPEAWRKILASDTCQIENAHGLFTCATIYPLRQTMGKIKSSSGSGDAAGESLADIRVDDYFWKIVSHIPKPKLTSGMRSLFVKLFFMAILLFLLASVPSWIIAKAIVRRKLHQLELYRAANFDKLTGLPNRSLFMDRLTQALKEATRYDKRLALFFIDLDGFKSVNDTLGHDMGDELLMQVAQRLSSCVRDSDTVARLGGDEFTVIFTHIAAPKDARTGAKKMIRTLSSPFDLNGHSATIGASIGISRYPDHGDDIQTLLKKADEAMYQVKKQGKNNYCEAPL